MKDKAVNLVGQVRLSYNSMELDILKGLVHQGTGKIFNKFIENYSAFEK